MDVTENVPGEKFSVTRGCGRAMSVITAVRNMEEWMNYKLYYFPIRGRGEQVRLFLHTLDVPFEDVLVKREQFLELQKQGSSVLSFGSLPMLEDGDFRLCQGPTILSYLASRHGVALKDPRASARADSIAWGAEDLRQRYFKLFGDDAAKLQEDFVEGDWSSRWAPNLNGLLSENGENGHFVGSSITHADVAVWDVLDAVLTNIKSASLKGAGVLESFYEDFRSRPTVAAYLESGKRLS